MHYGGLEHLVMFIDLDCRFDILRLSQSLKHKIMETSGKLYLLYTEKSFSTLFCASFI